jgi:hypothetical protein
MKISFQGLQLLGVNTHHFKRAISDICIDLEQDRNKNMCKVGTRLLCAENWKIVRFLLLSSVTPQEGHFPVLGGY